ncbi:hypothetical protein OHA71_23555 [Streptomyces sp. NBC_00444]|uniref:hypothetical protein n=1 Tax=Streptomyces sp. NBC_00444 TaxID=2975744 RepID=UPI002E1B5A18
MNGTATAAQWLACFGIGTCTSAAVLWSFKRALDAALGPANRPPEQDSLIPPPPALPARAPARRPRHAAPPLVDETQPITRVQRRARHAKDTQPCS